jgi:hypothetical protein
LRVKDAVYRLTVKARAVVAPEDFLSRRSLLLPVRPAALRVVPVAGAAALVPADVAVVPPPARLRPVPRDGHLVATLGARARWDIRDADSLREHVPVPRGEEVRARHGYVFFRTG